MSLLQRQAEGRDTPVRHGSWMNWKRPGSLVPRMAARHVTCWWNLKRNWISFCKGEDDDDGNGTRAGDGARVCVW